VLTCFNLWYNIKSTGREKRKGWTGMMLGNFSVERMEERLGIKFPKDLVVFMNANRQENANNIEEGGMALF
jgi:hypothetical protein